MKVLLVNPPAVGGVSFVREGRCEQRIASFQYNMLPISLLSTAALLREKGHEIRLIDAIARKLSPEDLLCEAQEFSPRLILVNVSTVTFRADSVTAGKIGQALPGALIAAYGVHVTALPEESLAEGAFDAVIKGEPEMTAAALAAALEEDTPLVEVKGISFRREGRGREAFEIIHNPDRPFLEDLDSLPPAARDLVDHRDYPAPVSGRPHTLISTSRGCPYSCIFCTARIYYGQSLRLRNPVKVVEEIEEAYRKWDLRLFTFWSDTFTLDRDHVLAICREIKKRKLPIDWMCNSRVDRVDLELLREMASSGCRIISFGVESGVQSILNNIKKGIKVEKIEEAFRLCRQAGIQSAAHVILGLPGETVKTARQTVKFVKGLNPDYVQYYGAVPFPGTPFYRQAKEEGWLRARDWDDFEINREIISTPDLSADQLRRCRQRAFLSFYLRPTYFAARLAEVRSPEDLRRLVRAGWSFIRSWVFTA